MTRHISRRTRSNEAGAAPVILIGAAAVAVILFIIFFTVILAALVTKPKEPGDKEATGSAKKASQNETGDADNKTVGDGELDKVTSDETKDFPEGSCLIYFWKVEDDFGRKVIAGGKYLETNPNWLMAVMEFESNLDPSRTNPDGGATGLIQFMPDTAQSLGTSTAALRGMSRSQQWPYVLRYLTPYRRRMRAMADTYMTVLNPYMVGHADTEVMKTKRKGQVFEWRSPGGGCAPGQKGYYCQNKGLDRAPHDGEITKFEAAYQVRRRYDLGFAKCSNKGNRRQQV